MGTRKGQVAPDEKAYGLAPGPKYARPGGPVEARQKEAAREHLQRAGELGRKLRIPEGA